MLGHGGDRTKRARLGTENVRAQHCVAMRFIEGASVSGVFGESRRAIFHHSLLAGCVGRFKAARIVRVWGYE